MRKILDKQLRILIDEAAGYGVPPIVMEKAIIPVLKLFLRELKNSKYFICQNPQGNWLMTTIQQKDNPTQQKKVIYAFTSQKDAWDSLVDRDLRVISLPVTEILLRLFSVREIDSLIFLDVPGNIIKGKEIDRVQMEQLIDEKIQTTFSSSPPNIA
jgi:hypothetical protein